MLAARPAGFQDTSFSRKRTPLLFLPENAIPHQTALSLSARPQHSPVPKFSIRREPKAQFSLILCSVTGRTSCWTGFFGYSSLFRMTVYVDAANSGKSIEMVEICFKPLT